MLSHLAANFLSGRPGAARGALVVVVALIAVALHVRSPALPAADIPAWCERMTGLPYRPPGHVDAVPRFDVACPRGYRPIVDEEMADWADTPD